MAAGPLRIESIDRLTVDSFVLNFSDDTVLVLTEAEMLVHFADRRTYSPSLDNSANSN